MEYVNSANQYFSEIPTLFAAGNAPDITGLLPGTGQTLALLPYAQKGQLAQITGPWTKGFSTAIAPLDSINGKYYAYSPDTGLFVLAYNKTLFQQYGLSTPTTLAGVLSACRKATAEGKVGLAVPGGEPAQLFNMITAMTGPVFANNPNWFSDRKKGTVTFDGTPGWRSALQQFVEMKNAGCFQAGAAATTVEQTTSMFTSGNALMIAAYSSTFAGLSAINPSLRYGELPMPGETAKQTSVLLNPGISFAVSSTSKVKTAAETFIDFVAQPRYAEKFSQAAGTPALSQVTQKDLPQEFSALEPAVRAGRTYAAPTNFYWNSLVYEAAQVNSVGLITGQATVDDVLKAMDQAWDKGAGATS